MSATHFHVADKSFLRFINAENTNPFSESSQRARQEGWSNAFDGAPSVEWAGSTVESIDYSADGEDDEDGAEHYPVHNLRIVNHSPGGFCLTWPQIGRAPCTASDGRPDVGL